MHGKVQYTGEEIYNKFRTTALSRGYAHLFQFFTDTAKGEAAQIVPLYPSAPAEELTIKYAMQPLSQNPKVFTVPVSEFCQVAGLPDDFVWTNSIYLPNSVKMFVQGNPVRSVDPEINETSERHSQTVHSLYENRKQTIKQQACFVICKIDQQVGWGVFAAQDLPANAFVGVYAGKLKDYVVDHQVGDQYSLEVRHPIFDLDAKQSSEAVGVISAQEMGNFTRFINAMPAPAEFEASKCIPAKKAPLVATANCTFSHGAIDDVPAQLVVTKRAIKKGEQLGLPYWSFNGVNGLFHKNTGRVLPKVKLLPQQMEAGPQGKIVLVRFYFPKSARLEELVFTDQDFVAALLKNHLISPNRKDLGMVHSDYFRQFALQMDPGKLQDICGDAYPKVQQLQQEFVREENDYIRGLMMALAQTDPNWQLSQSGGYHHFELQTSKDNARMLQQCFQEANCGFTQLEENADHAVLHWYEDPFQDAMVVLGQMLETVMRKMMSQLGIYSVPSLNM